MSPVAMADNPALLDPMQALRPPERSLLRKFYLHGPALSAGLRKGWMLNGVRYSDKAMNRFLLHHLAIGVFDPVDRHAKLQLTYAGRLAAERLIPSKPSPDPTSPDD